MLAGIQETWSRAELVLWPLSRIILVPVLAACAAPKHKPVIPGTRANRNQAFIETTNILIVDQ